MMPVHDADHGLGRCLYDIGGDAGALVTAGANRGPHRGTALSVAAAGHSADLEFLHMQLFIDDAADRVDDSVYRTVTATGMYAGRLAVETQLEAGFGGLLGVIHLGVNRDRVQVPGPALLGAQHQCLDVLVVDAFLAVGQGLELDEQVFQGFAVNAETKRFQAVAESIKDSTVCGLARAKQIDIERAGEAIKAFGVAGLVASITLIVYGVYFYRKSKSIIV